MIHASDAAARQINNGMHIRVFNDRGAFEGIAKISDDVAPGVVVSTLGYWWRKNRGGRAVNTISSDEFLNLGHAPSFSDNLVDVQRC